VKGVGVGAAALSSAGRSGSWAAEPGGERPNILFIMADDHTSQAFGCYGSRLASYARTPNIDGIAAEGALLQNCFCTNSICVPSRATILTGQHSHVNGATTLGGNLDPSQDNVAKHLQAAGYGTAIVGKWHLKREPAGFDYYNLLHGQGRYHNPVLWEKGDDWDGKGTEHEGHSTDIITDQALNWLRNGRSDDKPFALMCHFKAVHEPFHSHDRYRDLYDGVEFPEPEDLLWEESPKGKVFGGWPLETLADRFVKRPSNYSPPPADFTGMDEAARRRATYQKFIRDYLSAVAGIDDNIGRLLAYLEGAGLSDNTVVIYTSDQGYFLGEHNMFDKRFMLEESLRMPFVIRHPGEIEPGTVVEDMITNVDFAELFLDYANAEVPESMQGRSFRANLRGETPADWPEDMYYHYWSHSKERPSHYGIRTKRHKLIYYYGLVGMGQKPEECWELYDLETDPHELQNRIRQPRYRKIIADLKQRLEELRRETKDTQDPLAAS
jgi:arylsulfatase A-like enzyme